MASGRSNQLTRQIGEHLVAAKLGRMGYVATPFAGNVPMYDILAANLEGHAIPIQVKAINGPSWQFKADRFLEIEMRDGEQIVKGRKIVPNPDLICILVLLKENEHDEFYVLRFRDLQDIFFDSYKGGRRPRNPESMHCAVWPKELEQFRDNWQLLELSFTLSQTRT
jgi:hypothetical protein